MTSPRSAASSGDEPVDGLDDDPFDPLGFESGAAEDGRPSGPDSPAAALDEPVAPATVDGLRIEKTTAPRAFDVPGRGTVIPGHVSIAPRALHRVGVAVTAEHLRIDRDDIRITSRDDDGQLALVVETPVVIPPLGSVPADQVGLLDTIRSLQRALEERMAAIAGRSVSRVDVTVTRSVLAGSAPVGARVDRARVDRARGDGPRVDKPRVDRVDRPRVDKPRVDKPRIDRVDRPRVDRPRVDPPRSSPRRALR